MLMEKKDLPPISFDMNRRAFISKTALAGFGILIGTKLVHGHLMPEGYVPIVLQSNDPFVVDKKHKDLVVLNDRPWNIETPVHLLDDRVTPADKMFVRNNGNMPMEFDLDKWTLTIDGESVKGKKTYTLKELKSKFKKYSYQLLLECGGNGRAEFSPPTKGNQWTYGGVSCAVWEGARLKDILADVGIKSDAVYIGYYGNDTHLSGSSTKPVISRGVPIEVALNDETLVAWSMNGADIPYSNGFPLRLVVGGWPASVSGKWLNRISVRNKVHDGPKMEAPAYRIPCEPVEPGSNVPDDKMCIMGAQPVKSIITYPKTGAMLKPGQKLNLRGHAWAGDLEVAKVEVSIDYGATWQPTTLEKAANKNAWQHWSATVNLPKKGYYEAWVRATDSKGVSQPMISPAWNPKGYANNACHRIGLKVV